MTEIDFQHLHRRTACRCQALKDCAFPAEVLVPNIETRMKEWRCPPRNRIDACDVWAFVVVTLETSQSEVAGYCRSAMLFGDDVVDFVDGIRQRLGHLTIFAAGRGSLPNLLAYISVHSLFARMVLQRASCLRFDDAEKTTDLLILFCFDFLFVGKCTRSGFCSQVGHAFSILR